MILTKSIKPLVLFLLLGLSIWYLADELIYAISRDRSEHETLEWVVRIAHVFSTIPLLLLPIVQFSKRARRKRPALHRVLGRVYLTTAIIASLSALYLGFTFEETGRRPPLLVFAVLWFFINVAAWITARRRDFRNHAKFVIRSYGIALAFVLVRVMGRFELELFPFIENEEVRNATREWLAFVIPLLAIEAAVNWIPAVRQSKRR